VVALALQIPGRANAKVLRPASGLRMTNYGNVAIFKIL